VVRADTAEDAEAGSGEVFCEADVQKGALRRNRRSVDRGHFEHDLDLDEVFEPAPSLVPVLLELAPPDAEPHD
jgi:hypothetical protein